MKGVPIIKDNSSWSNAGGCGVLHPFNQEKRAECEQNQAKNIQAQADLELAGAIRDKQNQPKSTGWTATQTTMVVVGSLLALTVMVVVIKRARANK